MNTAPPFVRAARWLLLTLLLTPLTACGGSGGGGPESPPPPVALSLGLVISSTESTSHRVAFPTPGFDGFFVAAASTTGPVSLPESQFPVSITGGEANLTVITTPAHPGHVEGVVTLTIEQGEARATRVFTLSSRAEAPRVRLSSHSLDFGSVAQGTSSRKTTTVINDSEVSAVSLQAIAFGNGALSLIDPLTPARIGPGEQIDLTIQFAPTAPTVIDATVALPIGLSPPLSLALTGSSALGGSETVTEFGSQTLESNGNTPELSIDVPADAISITFEAEGSGSDQLGLGYLVGPNDRVYENIILTGAYIWTPQVEHFSTTVPNTDRSQTQLVAGGGTYRFRLRKLSGPSSSLTVRVRMERRDDVSLVPNVLPLNVWLASGLSVSASGAPSDTRMQAILARIDTILTPKNIRLGDVDYYDLTNSAYDVIDSTSELQSIARLSSTAAENRLNLVFASTVLGGGVVGVSLRIAGPKKQGSPFAAVASIYSGSSENFIGLVAAHEIGHFLGLFHTTEQNGAHDFIDDTPQCPAHGAGGPCSVAGGGLLMHWQALGGTTITDGQALVIRGHPYVEAGVPVSPRQAQRQARVPGWSRALLPWGPDDDAAAARAGPCWCGSCSSSAGKRAATKATAK